MSDQSPIVSCMPVIGVASGCHEVPEPSRDIEYGPKALFMCILPCSWVVVAAAAGLSCPFMSCPGVDDMSCG